MPLFIPTATQAPIPFAGWPTQKGQLYNLDTNDYISFQFNPDSFDWEQVFNWAEITWQGDYHGGDLQFINAGPHTFDLPLQFLADPGAPKIGYNTPSRISTDMNKFDFGELKRTLDDWNKPIEGKGRPARIKVIMGENKFDGVVTRWKFRILDFFPDMTAKEVLMTISFREWVLDVVW